MIGRELNPCVNTIQNDHERYKRCLFTDMKIAIDALKDLDDKLKKLHPDVFFKVRQLL